MPDLTPETWLQHWKPRRPKAGDNPQDSGLYQMTREKALTKRQIQVNAPAIANMMTFDIDLDDENSVLHIIFLAEAGIIPRPSWIVHNPANDHCHIGYLIDNVGTGPNAAEGPRSYYRAVRRTMTMAMKADPAYAGYATKNPLLDLEHTYWGPDHVFTLTELADWFDGQLEQAVKLGEGVQDIDPSAGRNQALFNKVAPYTHRTWRRHALDKSSGKKGHLADVMAFAKDLNVQDNPNNPLPESQVEAVVRTEVNWTWSRFSEKAVIARQKAISSRQASVKTKAERVQTIKDTAESGHTMTAREVAETFGVSERTAFSYLADAGLQGTKKIEVQDNVALVGRLRAEGKSYTEIENITGLTRDQIRYAIKKHNKG